MVIAQASTSCTEAGSSPPSSRACRQLRFRACTSPHECELAEVLDEVLLRTRDLSMPAPPDLWASGRNERLKFCGIAHLGPTRKM